MPIVWTSDDHLGLASTSTLVTEWASVTMPRPVARLAMNGNRPFCVKQVSFKCCAAPKLGQKLYARISNADGSVFDNSYIGNVISWQNEAKVVYSFAAIQLHFADDGGQKLRLWLLGGGPFYIARGALGGSTQTNNGEYGGAAVANYKYVQIALPPKNVKAYRNPKDWNETFLSWTPWDIKDDIEQIGDSTSVSGYCVQVAQDANFTKKVGVRYVTMKNGVASIFGLYYGYDWYFRMSTRNEVSEKYDLPGGSWGESFFLPKTEYDPTTPGANTGLPGGANGGTAGSVGYDTDTGSGGDLSGNNPDSTSNSGGTSQVSDGTATVTQTVSVVDTVVKAGKENIGVLLPPFKAAMQACITGPTETAWKALNNQVDPIAAQVTILKNKATDPATQSAWLAIENTVLVLKARLLTAAQQSVSAASAAASLASAIAAMKFGASQITNLKAAALAAASVPSYNDLALSLDDLRDSCARGATAAAALNVPAAPFTAAANQASTAAAYVRTAVAGGLKATDAAVGTGAAATARDLARAAYDGIVVPSNDYTVAYKAAGDFVDAIEDALLGTDEQKLSTVVIVIPKGTVVPSTTIGVGGTSAVGSTTGGAVTDTSGTVVSSNGTKVVYSPIPDTSATRTATGGLLLSSSPGRVQRTTVYVMDRGGRTRIGELKDPTLIEWNRIRDDTSTCRVVLDGNAVRKNRQLLDDLAVGRHEALVYRGGERVWEGPITLAKWTRDSFELSAKDITHYLNRTVMKAAYSNAFPNMAYVVARIAGIIAAELSIKEALSPPVNVLPFMRTYIEQGDARTTRVTLPAEMTVWQHLDDMAAKSGIDYTVIGRALHIWDTSRPAIGRTRIVTEADFSGEVYISAYGMELATQTFVTDGQGNFGSSGGVDDFYGEVDLLSTAYDENGAAVDLTDDDTTNDTVPVEQMVEQAERNLEGRNPTPLALHVPDGSGFRLDRGIGIDNLIPGVYIPVVAKLAGRTLTQTMKLKELKMVHDASGETATITMTPASASGDSTLAGDGDGAAE